MTISLIEGITLSIAVLGAALGIINTLHNINKTRVKLKVIPKHAIPTGGMDPNLRMCIEIVNLGSIAVTIEDAGVFYHGTKKRGAITQPVFSGGGGWPKRLEPRAALTVYCQRAYSQEGQKIKNAYARTECGVTKTGNSDALKQIANEQNL
jgi:hypothetical protein